MSMHACPNVTYMLLLCYDRVDVLCCNEKTYLRKQFQGLGYTMPHVPEANIRKQSCTDCILYAALIMHDCNHNTSSVAICYIKYDRAICYCYYHAVTVTAHAEAQL